MQEWERECIEQTELRLAVYTVEGFVNGSIITGQVMRVEAVHSSKLCRLFVS